MKGNGYQSLAIIVLHGKVQMGPGAITRIARFGNHLACGHRLTDGDTRRGGPQVDIDGHGAIGMEQADIVGPRPIRRIIAVTGEVHLMSSTTPALAASTGVPSGMGRSMA